MNSLKKMNLTIFLVIWTLVMSIQIQKAHAFEMGPQKVEVTVSENYVSRYIWRGQDLYGENDGAHQPSVDIALPGLFSGTDVSFNIWGSFPLSEGHEIGEELDYTVTLSRDLGNQFNLSAGYTYFDFPKANAQTDVSEPWITLALTKIPALPIDVAMSVFAGYDFQAASGGPDEGWYCSWGFDTELPLFILPLTQDGQTLAIGLTNWGNDGVADLEPSFLYATELSFSTSYQFSGVSISPSLNYTVNYKEEINDGNEEFWGGIEISYAF